MRKAKVVRKTTEVTINLELSIDGTGEGQVKTGITFLDHLLLTLAKHSLFDLKVEATGDLKHHISEDVALSLGEALDKALLEKKGIRRFGSAFVPMDEALAFAAVDLGGRAYTVLEFDSKDKIIEDLKTEDIQHFFDSLANTSKTNVHIAVLYGKNEHHKIEAAIKAFALALKQAVTIDPRRKTMIPSAKGVI